MIPPIESVYTPIPWLVDGGDLRCWRLTFLQPVPFVLDEADILEQPQVRLENRLHISENPERTFGGRFSVLVREDATGIASLLTAIERTQCTGSALLRIHPPVGFTADPVTIARGTLASMERSRGAVRLTFECSYPSAGKPVCRDASQIPDFATLPPQTFLPQLFGRRGFLMPPLFAVQTAKLAGDFSATATTLSLTRATNWPPTGFLQINDEVLSYRARSEDGLIFGSASFPLIRPQRRAHDHGATVLLLPGPTVDWCAADHDAEVLETRAESEEGPLANAGAVVHEDLDGIVATLWRADRLPLRINTSRIPTVDQSALNAASWRVLAGTNVLDYTDAFINKAPARGAVFTTGRRLLVANFVEDHSLSSDRFDLIEHAELYFEFSDTPFWGAGTRLRVTIEKGASSIQAEFNRDGVLFPVPVIAQAALPAPLSAARTERHRIHFEQVSPIGPWTNAAAAIDAAFQDAATCSSAQSCALTARFVSERNEAQLAITQVELHARVRNNGAASFPVQLVIDVPGKLYRTADATIAAAATQVVSLIVALPSDLPPADLFAPTCLYALIFPAGGDMGVEEIWIDATSTVAIDQAAISAAISSLPVVGSATMRVDYNSARVDITALLPPGARWDFFSTGGGLPKVVIELIDPPAITNWAVYIRDLHWNWRTRAATSVRPTARLWGLVEGRRTRPDGTANPALALRDLIAEDALGAAPETDTDSASFAALEDLADERGVRFAAVFMEATPLSTIIGRAVAQSTLKILFWDGLWRLAAAPLQVDSEASLIFPRSECFVPTGDQHWTPQRPGDVGGLALVDGNGAIAHRIGTRAALTTLAQWIMEGAPAVAINFDSRRHPPVADIGIDFDARWFSIPAGAQLSLPGVAEPEPSRRSGELA